MNQNDLSPWIFFGLTKKVINTKYKNYIIYMKTFYLVLLSFINLGVLSAQIVPLGDTPCDAPTKTVSDAPCRTLVQTRYEANFSTTTFTDYLPNQTACNSAEEPYDAWLQFVAAGEATAITWQDLSSNNHALYLYKELNTGNCPNTEPSLEFLFCIDREYLTSIRYE